MKRLVILCWFLMTSPVWAQSPTACILDCQAVVDVQTDSTGNLVSLTFSNASSRDVLIVFRKGAFVRTRTLPANTAMTTISVTIPRRLRSPTTGGFDVDFGLQLP